MARKTYTSSEVKNRWNKNNYYRTSAMIPKELGEKFKEKCKRENISMNSVFVQAVENFVKED